MGQLTVYSGRARARARVDDILRVLSATLLSVVAAVARRAWGRRRRVGWSFGLEVTIAAYRGSWSMMPKIGLVRWRNVGEELSPLRLDGLTPRFVEYSSGGRPTVGAWLEPPDASRAVMLYLHGGGFAFASLRTHGPHIAALARAARARTLAIEYRLAPEHPAPAALEDALNAYRHLLSEGIPPTCIVLAGDSAGGTLVLSTLLALRDAGEPLPAAGVAICPWVDLECADASFETNAAFDFVGRVHCRLAAASYLAGADARRPDISPLYADLAGLPPLLVQGGEAEVLIDQVREFARRAAAAHVAVRCSVYEDMVHVWHMMSAAVPQARQAIDEVGSFVQLHASKSMPGGGTASA